MCALPTLHLECWYTMSVIYIAVLVSDARDVAREISVPTFLDVVVVEIFTYFPIVAELDKDVIATSSAPFFVTDM